MEDSQIIDLYWQRNESAITKTDQKYGAFCHRISLNILSIKEDSEECVNDTYHHVWNSIPPSRPDNFRAWLGRIVRNLSINLWNKKHTQKRYNGITELLSELEDCIPSPKTVENEIEEKELSKYISTWLKSLSSMDRTLFVRRYWLGTALNELAATYHISSGKLAQRMYRLRLDLKSYLEKEGVSL